jgi:hypothetical protein
MRVVNRDPLRRSLLRARDFDAEDAILERGLDVLGAHLGGKTDFPCMDVFTAAALSAAADSLPSEQAR